MLLRNVFTKTLRDLRWPTFWVALALAILAGYFTLLFPTYTKMFNLDEILGQMPAEMKALIGGTMINASTVNGFLNLELFPLMLPIVLGGFAAGLASGFTAGEESRGTIDMLLSYPVPRWRVLLDKWLALVLALVVIAVVMLAGIVLGAVASASELATDGVVAGLVMVTLLALDFAGIALLISSATGNRGAGIGISVAFLVVMYFIQALAPMIEVFNSVRKFSLFYWYLENDPLQHGLAVGDAVVLAVVAVLLFAASLVAFERRNLSA